MIKFSVNDLEIPFTQIWYHHQDIPRPGGYVYLIKISLEEIKLIEIFEKFTLKKVRDPFFSNEALKKIENYYNLVNWVIDYLSEKYPENIFDIKWVFNNIEKVEIQDEQILISGIASPALDNYV